MKQPSDAAPTSLSLALENLGRAMEKRAAENQAAASPQKSTPDKPASTLRPAPEGDDQPDFFVPGFYDVAVKDTFSIMDVAVFRLGKSQTRKGEIIRHVRDDHVLEVASDARGMATIYDYDIVLFMISHLADQTRLWREGLAAKPARAFRPHSTDIFKFCRMQLGGESYARLEQALDRLKGTTLKFIKKDQTRSRSKAIGLIGGYDIVSYTAKDRIGTIEIDIPDWIYDAVTTHTKPEVLTVNRDYFLIDSGLARFVYRLARKAAGTNEATYAVSSIHERTGSTRDFRKFLYDLKQLVAANDLPEYSLDLIDADNELLLRMTRRPFAQPALTSAETAQPQNAA